MRLYGPVSARAWRGLNREPCKLDFHLILPMDMMLIAFVYVFDNVCIVNSPTGRVASSYSTLFSRMSPNPPTHIATPRYKRHRFAIEILTHAVWLYFRFPLSLRHVEDLLAERRIEVSFQTVSE